MKLGVSITSFREKQIIPIIKQYQGIADKIVLAVSKKPWCGDLPADDTYERALTTGITVLHDYWPLEEQQRNATMELLRDCDYVLASHSDTFFTKSDLMKLKEMELTDRNYGCNTLTYWKNYNTVIEPNITLPGIIIKADSVFLNSINIVDQNYSPKELPITCHHVSWVRSDDEIKSKISSYSHASEVRPDWFDSVWKTWDESVINFGPTKPRDFKTVRNSPLPKEILDTLL